MWRAIFEVHGEFPGHGSFGPGPPLAKPSAEGSLSVPSARCPGDPCPKGRQRGSGGRIDCDENLGRRATGDPGTHVGRQ